MSKQLLSEKQVLNELGVKDFRSITKESIMSFASMLDRVDSEVALAIVGQFDNFAAMSTEIFKEYTSLISEIMETENISHDESMAMYKQCIDTCSDMLSVNEDLTPEQRLEVLREMGRFADAAALKDTEKKQHDVELLKSMFGITLSIIGGGLAILGVVKKGKDIIS